MYHFDIRKFTVLLNYTDTALSHRFIRFEVPFSIEKIVDSKIDEFMMGMYKQEQGTVYH